MTSRSTTQRLERLIDGIPTDLAVTGTNPGDPGNVRDLDWILDTWGHRLGPSSCILWNTLARWVDDDAPPVYFNLTAWGRRLGLSPQNARSALARLRQFRLVAVDTTGDVLVQTTARPPVKALAS